MGKKNRKEQFRLDRELEKKAERNLDKGIQKAKEQTLNTIVMELRKISEMLNSVPPAIAGKKRGEGKIYTVGFGLDVCGKTVTINGKNIFYCVLNKDGNIVATVCLLILKDRKSAARGIAIRGPEDTDISLEKGRSIAFSRASFVAEEGKNTCHIRGRNRNIDIVKALFKSKYKAQYAPELTDYEKHLVSNI